MPAFRIAATVNAEQLATLVLAAKAADVTLELGVALEDVPSPRRKYKQRKRSTKPQRFRSGMQVRVGPEPGVGPPKLRLVHKTLRKKFGDNPFRKGEAKKVLLQRKITHPTGYVTQLMHGGNLLPA